MGEKRKQSREVVEESVTHVFIFLSFHSLYHPAHDAGRFPGSLSESGKIPASEGLSRETKELEREEQAWKLHSLRKSDKGWCLTL